MTHNKERYNYEKSWHDKHCENIEKYGQQDLDILLLCALEELGELTRAYLHYRFSDNDIQRLYDELTDLAALMHAINDAIERGNF